MDYHSPKGTTSQLAGMVPNPTDLSRRLESTQKEQEAKENCCDKDNSITTPSRSPNSVPRVDLQPGSQLWDTTFSPSPTHRSPVNLQCCCGSDDCPNLAAFLRSLKSMEDQLRLAAEIGQALLHQQEGYQKEIKECQQKLEHQKKLINTANTLDELEELMHEFESSQRTLTIEKDDATRQKNILENRSEALTEALESSDKRVVELTNELERLDNEVKRLMAHNLLGERIEEREEMLSRQLEDLKQELHFSRKAEFAAESKLENEQKGSRKSKGKLEAVAMLRESKSPLPNPNNEANSHLINLIKELSSANNKLKSEISEYRDLLAESRNEVGGLQSQIDDLETARVAGYLPPGSYAASTFQPNYETGENKPSSTIMFMDEIGDTSNNIPGTAARSINPHMSPVLSSSFGPGSYNTFNSLGVDPSVHSPVGSVVSSSMLSSSNPNPLHVHHHYYYHPENNDIVQGNLFGELEKKYIKKPRSKGPKFMRSSRKNRKTIPEFDEKIEDQFNDENIAQSEVTGKKYVRSEGEDSASDRGYNTGPNEERDDIANNVSEKRSNVSLLSVGLRSVAEESNTINQAQEQEREKSPTKIAFEKDADRRPPLANSAKRLSFNKSSTATTSAQQHKPTQSSPLAVHRRNASGVSVAVEDPQSSNSPAVDQKSKGLQTKPSLPAFKNPKFATLGPKERKIMMEAWRADVAKEQQQKGSSIENNGFGNNLKIENQSTANNGSDSATIKGKIWNDMPNSPIKVFVEGVLVDEANLSAAEAAAFAHEVQNGLTVSGTKSAHSCQASTSTPLLITNDVNGSKRESQLSESLQNQNPYQLLFNLASHIMDRMKGTDLMALNRRLKRTFDILELTNLSNNLIENILSDVENFRERFRWVEELCNNDEMKTNPKMAFNDLNGSENYKSQKDPFMFSPEHFLPLVHLLQDLLGEIGKLRMIINDVQVSYVQKVDENRRKAEEEFGKSVLGGKDDERIRRRERALSQSSDGGFGAYLSRVFGGVKEAQSVTPVRHHNRRRSVDFLHDRDVSVGSIDTFAEDNYYIDRNLESYLRSPDNQRVYKRRESNDSSVGSIVRRGVISLFGGVGNSTSGKKNQKIDRADNLVNAKNGKTKYGNALASRSINGHQRDIPSNNRHIRNSLDISTIPIRSPSSTTIQYPNTMRDQDIDDYNGSIWDKFFGAK
ncbi:24681_t:CDS:2 [Dentiscutata erythropus]|uniref:24681_t:CDS:1 n=1 Tax=Dentiscutata erythropus TaxID=1348616 RepID=A0A9N9EHM1_9GLOM|nr:24681_t:CDS:2 [Dentiscutata erythropus]